MPSKTSRLSAAAGTRRQPPSTARFAKRARAAGPPSARSSSSSAAGGTPARRYLSAKAATAGCSARPSADSEGGRPAPSARRSAAAAAASARTSARKAQKPAAVSAAQPSSRNSTRLFSSSAWRMLRLSLALASVQRSKRCLYLKRGNSASPRAPRKAGAQAARKLQQRRPVTSEKVAGQPPSAATTWFSSMGVNTGSGRAALLSKYTHSSPSTSERMRPSDWYTETMSGPWPMGLT
nr:hypothetical protein Docile-S101_00057 [Bovine alphaherpesvirus 1]